MNLRNSSIYHFEKLKVRDVNFKEIEGKEIRSLFRSLNLFFD